MAERTPSSSAPSGSRAPKATEPTPRLDFPVIGVGASAGGLEAFTEFLSTMPPNSGMALVFILHLPPDRESLLREVLAPRTDMTVVEISDGVRVEPNRVYVIRPGFTVTLSDGVFRLGEPLEKHGHRHPIDDFFRSLAAEQGERGIGIILSGMGSNGTLGARSLREAGGFCVAQRPDSAKFPSMPQSLIHSGDADFVLRPADIPKILVHYSTHPYARGAFAIDGDAQQDASLRRILELLRSRGFQDFDGYKKATLVRRIERRMSLKQAATMGAYAEALRQDAEEVAALADDLLIHVTGFFRDPETWETLRQKVIAPLAAERASGSAIRAWVTACSSGEESYTLAILLAEAALSVGKHFDVKIFATDVAGRSVTMAREGVYPAAIESELSAERLERFFDRVDSTYRAKKELREMIVFAPQNLLQDPPFSRLDLCTCRNLLIYLEPAAQQRVLSLMHFALREGGVMLLGTSETISGADDLFDPIDKKARLFRRLGPTRHGLVEFPLSGLPAEAHPAADPRSSGNLPRGAMVQLTQQALLHRYGPPSVVIDRSQRVVYFHGQTGRFLGQPGGEPSRELLVLVHDSLRGPLRKALMEALEHQQPVKTEPALLEADGRRFLVEIRVSPLDLRNAPGYFLVSFEERRELPPPVVVAGGSPDEDRAQLEQELRRVREELQSNISELQANNEELRASNEETISINEELQSSNEELETSKEELQSLNEELTTVNAQLQAKMVELEAMTSDLDSLLRSTNIAVLFLDAEFRIRRFTPAVRDLLQLIPGDVGRPLHNLALKFTDENLLTDAHAVLGKGTKIEREIASTSGRTYIRSVLPYRTTRERIEGVVITFVDITDRKRAELALAESEEQHRLMVDGLQDHAIFLLDPTGVITTWPQAAEKMFGYSRAEAVGRPLSLIMTADEAGTGALAHKLADAQQRGSATHEGWRRRKDGTTFWGSGVLSAVRGEKGALRGFVKILRDRTEARLAEEELRRAKQHAEAANEAKDQFLATLSHELRTPLSSIVLWASLIDEQGTTEPEQLKEAVAAIKKGAKEQHELIEDLVDTARIAAGKLRLDRKPTDLAEVGRSVLASIGATAMEKRLIFEPKIAPDIGIVSVDPIRLRQVMNNLLANAVKFTDAGGKIGLDLARRGDDVTLTVTDTGEGFDAEFQSHLFARFEQGPKPVAKLQGGLGIGLSIAKEIVARHGGTILGESPGVGRGSTFTVRLPLPKLAPIPEGKPGRTGASPVQDVKPLLRNKRILVVEDSLETKRALMAVLAEAGAVVTSADTAPTALALFQRERPDLIISDVGLPEVNGYQFIAQLRETERRRQATPVPAIALTAFAGEETMRQALASGFQRCLSKPIEPQQLLSVLAELQTAAGGA